MNRAKEDAMAPRRSFLSRIALLPFAPQHGWAVQKAARPVLKILMKSAWGSDDPTKAAFPFLHGLALAEAGHQVQDFLFVSLVEWADRMITE